MIIMSGNFSLMNRRKFVMSSSATRKGGTDLRHDLIIEFMFFIKVRFFLSLT